MENSALPNFQINNRKFGFAEFSINKTQNRRGSLKERKFGEAKFSLIYLKVWRSQTFHLVFYSSEFKYKKAKAFLLFGSNSLLFILIHLTLLFNYHLTLTLLFNYHLTLTLLFYFHLILLFN